MRQEPVRKPESLDRDHRYLELLVQTGEILGESLDYQETLQNVCDAAVHSIADICLVNLGQGDQLHLAAARHRDRSKNEELQDAGWHLRNGERLDAHPSRHVMKTGRALLLPIVDDASLRAHATSHEHEQFMRRMKYRSMIVVPLTSRTQGVLGTLSMIRTNLSTHPYDETDLRFALELGRRCATAIAKSLLYAQTLHVATQYQRAALPETLPKPLGVTFDAYYEPSSEELLVGGDWYDAFELRDGRVAMTIGDVLGHGIRAAVWMSRLRNSLRAALLTEPDAAGALIVADHLMRLEIYDDFTTALVAIFDPVRRTFTCASAGHPGPLVWSPDGTVTDPFTRRSLPLGIGSPADRPQTAESIILDGGSFSTFFTDGLVEWNRDFIAGMEAVSSAMHARSVRESEHPARAIREYVLNAEPHSDDIAILTMRVDDLTMNV